MACSTTQCSSSASANQRFIPAVLFTVAGVIAFGVAARAMDAESREDAVKVAEQFIRDGHYDTARKCPEELARLDAQGHYDMQPHCQHYAAAEPHAFAVQETEIFWVVYFRKVPPTCHEGEESLRVVQVFRSSFPTGPRVILKDIELSMSKEAEVLRPNKSMQPMCAAARG
jgi:hypothetical protein